MNDNFIINQPSCADAIDASALSVSEAMQRIEAMLKLVEVYGKLNWVI